MRVNASITAAFASATEMIISPISFITFSSIFLLSKRAISKSHKGSDPNGT